MSSLNQTNAALLSIFQKNIWPQTFNVQFIYIYKVVSLVVYQIKWFLQNKKFQKASTKIVNIK